MILNHNLKKYITKRTFKKQEKTSYKWFSALRYPTKHSCPPNLLSCPRQTPATARPPRLPPQVWRHPLRCGTHLWLQLRLKNSRTSWETWEPRWSCSRASTGASGNTNPPRRRAGRGRRRWRSRLCLLGKKSGSCPTRWMKRRRFALVYRYVCRSRSFHICGTGGNLKPQH